MANKVIEIGFKKKVQPVRIAGIDFEIDMTEKARKKQETAMLAMQADMEVLQKESIELQKNGGDSFREQEILDATISTVEKAVDLMLGEGSYQKLYEAAGEDHEIVFDAFLDLANALNSMNEKKKAEAYISGKKKRK